MKKPVIIKVHTGESTSCKGCIGDLNTPICNSLPKCYNLGDNWIYKYKEEPNNEQPDNPSR